MDDLVKTYHFEKDISDVNKIPAVSKILDVIRSTTGMGFASVARVTNDRWIACAVADQINFNVAAGDELKVETTLCSEVMKSNTTIAIDHADEDPTYRDHHTMKMYGLQSYISIPLILNNGEFFGTLCAIHPEPASVNNEKTINMFKLFAELIAFNLDTIQNLSETALKLQKEEQNSETREQFIAILGHDLRNPVHAISNAAQLMLRSTLDERNTRLVKIIQSSTNRTKGLIDNILDFAQGRLGDGIQLNFENKETLEETLNQVVTELRMVYPEQEIITDYHLEHPVKGDYKRIAQLFSNLLANAITHGEKETPVTITATTGTDYFELCVTNKGTEISAETQKHLFKPFSRGTVHQGQEGLGLGLYISTEIALAHDGSLTVNSTPEETCFTLRIPQ